MNFIQTNYFNYQFNQKFDGIITDIPYKGAITNKLNEEKFNFFQFMNKIFNETKENSFFIIFSNFLCANDLINIGKEIGWKFHTYQIWNKMPFRTWISWNYP